MTGVVFIPAGILAPPLCSIYQVPWGKPGLNHSFTFNHQLHSPTYAVSEIHYVRISAAAVLLPLKCWWSLVLWLGLKSPQKFMGVLYASVDSFTDKYRNERFFQGVGPGRSWVTEGETWKRVFLSLISPFSPCFLDAMIILSSDPLTMDWTF